MVARVKSVSITKHGGDGNRHLPRPGFLNRQSLFSHRRQIVDSFSTLLALAADVAHLTQHPQFAQALALSVGSAAAATLLALGASACILSTGLGLRTEHAPTHFLPAMLALPHVAFALGCVLLLAPSGVLVRLLFALLQPWADAIPWPLHTPPPWQTTQDPWAMGLIGVLVCKEIPFLLWGALAHMQRPDLASTWQVQLRIAATLGYSAHAAWWRVVWPQLLPRMSGPLLAVWAYSLSVVDVAWIIGPGVPPTLAVLAWQWLQDADPATRAQGLAAALWLLLCTGVLAGIGVALYQLDRRFFAAQRWSCGLQSVQHCEVVQAGARRAAWGRAWIRTLPVTYAGIAAALLWASVVGVWPFPALWPQTWTLQAWQQTVSSTGALGTTLWLGLASAAGALLLAVICLECFPMRWRAALFGASYLPLVLPALLWALGLQRLCMAMGWDADAWGLWLAHTLSVWPYVLLSLQGPYAALDPRGAQVAASLGRSRWAYLWQVQWPLLRAALVAAFAVGFAVSVAQFLPTVFVGGGRFATVTTEAVALSSGGQRSLVAALALLQWLLPAGLFVLALWLGRKRRFATPVSQTVLA